VISVIAKPCVLLEAGNQIDGEQTYHVTLKAPRSGFSAARATTDPTPATTGIICEQEGLRKHAIYLKTSLARDSCDSPFRTLTPKRTELQDEGV
jgi:hypothetical protein